MHVVNLTKNQSVSLAKSVKASLTNLSFGLGWDAAKPKSGLFSKLFGASDSGAIDLDASCALLNSAKDVLDIVWFRQLTSKCAAVKHSGDNLTGEGEGDDETISVNLQRLSTDVEYIVLTVNSFRNQTFNAVDNAYCRVIDDSTNQEIARFSLSEKGPHTGIIVAALTRNGGAWDFKALGDATNANMVKNMIDEIKASL